MLRLIAAVRRIADIDVAVLIVGETGTGKELVARALHAASERSARAMVSVNCGALPEALAESEMFGHERGSFTGAERATLGYVETAAGGTLFLDEVNSLPAAVQPKLLRFLEHGEVHRVGQSRSRVFDVRVISACNVDPLDLVARERLRRDVFERLNVLRIDVPPLRDRLEDLPLLVAQFFEQDLLAARMQVGGVSDGVMAQLHGYAWPGNVRELWNVLRRSLVFGTRNGMLVELDHTHGTAEVSGAGLASGTYELPCFRTWMKEREREYLVELVRRHGTAAERAGVAGLPERTLYRKLEGLRRDTFVRAGRPSPPLRSMAASPG